MKPSARPLALLCAAFSAALFAVTLSACGNGVGDPCGGSSSRTCAADQFCYFGNDQCGRDGTVGRCELRPLDEECDPLSSKFICGCDGRVYADLCRVWLNGSDLDQSGSCPPEPGKFACGYRQCDLGQTCRRMPSDIEGDPDIFTCGS